MLGGGAPRLGTTRAQRVWEGEAGGCRFPPPPTTHTCCRCPLAPLQCAQQWRSERGGKEEASAAAAAASPCAALVLPQRLAPCAGRRVCGSCPTSRDWPFERVRPGRRGPSGLPRWPGMRGMWQAPQARPGRAQALQPTAICGGEDHLAAPAPLTRSGRAQTSLWGWRERSGGQRAAFRVCGLLAPKWHELGRRAGGDAGSWARGPARWRAWDHPHIPAPATGSGCCALQAPPAHPSTLATPPPDPGTQGWAFGRKLHARRYFRARGCPDRRMCVPARLAPPRPLTIAL